MESIWVATGTLGCATVAGRESDGTEVERTGAGNSVLKRLSGLTSGVAPISSVVDETDLDSAGCIGETLVVGITAAGSTSSGVSFASKATAPDELDPVDPFVESTVSTLHSAGALI